MPKVLNKWTDLIPPDAVYIGWPSKWSNPWHIGQDFQGHPMSRDEVLNAHWDWLYGTDEGKAIAEQARRELRGKDLTCWCAPLPCHADVLLEVANV